MRFYKGDRVKIKGGNVIYLIIKVKGTIIHVEGFFTNNVDQVITGTIDTSCIKMEKL
jgi:hypothetical protein